MDDISYSFSENAPANTANGWLIVDSDDYDLFLRWHGMGYGDEQRVSTQSAAELLWKEFLTHAGIDCDRTGSIPMSQLRPPLRCRSLDRPILLNR